MVQHQLNGRHYQQDFAAVVRVSDDRVHSQLGQCANFLGTADQGVANPQSDTTEWVHVEVCLSNRSWKGHRRR